MKIKQKEGLVFIIQKDNFKGYGIYKITNNNLIFIKKSINTEEVILEKNTILIANSTKKAVLIKKT